MSTDPKPPKPMPSADEINAYLEASAARTKMRLPLAKGSALGGLPAAAPTPPEESAARALPVSGSKKLPVRTAQPGGGKAVSGQPSHSEKDGADTSPAEAWRPFSNDDER